MSKTASILRNVYSGTFLCRAEVKIAGEFNVLMRRLILDIEFSFFFVLAPVVQRPDTLIQWLSQSLCH